MRSTENAVSANPAENLPDVDTNTSYSIAPHCERTELDAPPEMTAGTGEVQAIPHLTNVLEASIPGSSKDLQPREMDQDVKGAAMGEGDQSAKERQLPKEYSAEARAHHARYDEVSVADTSTT